MTKISKILSLLSISILAAAQYFQFLSWDFDDGCIVYRIARNLASGHGWAFNAGEAHNASTSVLNTIVIALGALLSSNISMVAHVLATFWIFCSAALFYLMLCRKTNSPIACGGAFALIIHLANNATWGLEFHLFAALLLLFCYFEFQRWNSWPIVALAILTRPDALVLAGLKWIHDLLRHRTLSFKGVAQVGIMLAPWAAYSIYNFGQLFPDTLSHKMWQGNSGLWGHGRIYVAAILSRIQEGGSRYQLWLIVGMISSLVLLVRKNPLSLIALFAVIQQGAYVLLNVPGYHWYFSLFDLTVLLVNLYALASLIGRYEGFPLSLGAVLHAVLPIVCCVYFVKMRHYTVLDNRNESYKHAMAEINAAQIAPGALAAVEVGTFAYATDRPVVDMTGLTTPNPEFVSGKNTDLFFAHPPRLVILHEPSWHFERSIYEDPRFEILYGEGVVIGKAELPLRYFVLAPDKDKRLAELISPEMVDRYVSSHYSAFKCKEQNAFNIIAKVNDSCILDQVNGILAQEPVITLPKTVLHIRGWAVDREERATSSDIWVSLAGEDGSRYVLPAKRVERNDVAAVLVSDAFKMAGYEVSGLVKDMPSGEYGIQVLQGREEEKYILCTFLTRIRLKAD